MIKFDMLRVLWKSCAIMNCWVHVKNFRWCMLWGVMCTYMRLWWPVGSGLIDGYEIENVQVNISIL